MTSARVGVVGLGLMGQVHAGNLIDLGAEVVAGADVAPEPRERFEAEFDVPTYEDHTALLTGESPDAVVVTTPNKFHAPAAIAALDRDCSVFVEKPLAHSLDVAEQIAAAASESAACCMVGFYNRFSPAAETARAYRDAGRFGEVTHVEATLVRRRGIPNPGSWFTDADLSGGGALVDIGAHVVDLALYMLDFPPLSEAVGVTRSNFGARDDYADPEGFGATWEGDGGTFDVEDSVSGFVRTEDGRTVSLEVAWAANRPSAQELLVRGTDAGARFDLESDALELYETSRLGGDHHVTSEIDAGDGRDGHVAELEHFLDAVEAGRPPTMNTVEEGLVVQRALDALYRSSRSGRARSIDASQPRSAGSAD